MSHYSSLRSPALAVALLTVTGAAVAAPPADLDAYVARAMSSFEAPGMAIAIVEGGKTTLAKATVQTKGKVEDDHIEHVLAVSAL